MGKNIDNNCNIDDSHCCCHSHSHSNGHGHGHHHGGDKRSFIASAVSFVMLMAGLIASHLRWAVFSIEWVEPAWYLLAFFPVGLPVIRECWETTRKGDIFNEFLLMTIACIGAFAIGEYPEGVGVMLFYTIGETLQHRAVARATKNISGLIDRRPDKALVVRENGTVSVSPADVRVGEVIEVRPGQRVPLDGIMEQADGLFDTSALTGESVPREIEAGAEVLAGMISLRQTARIRVTRLYSQSALSRILDMVKNASARKAHAELFIRKFARIYTPVVMALALLIVVVPALVALVNPSFNYVFADWLYKGLVFLVISCPCALVISVPLGYFAGIGAASRAGILFKGGNFLEAITKVRTVAFDKTGTLTTGKFHVLRVDAEGIPQSELLSAIASVECKSTHPLAKTLVAYVTGEGITIPDVEEMCELTGLGAEGRVKGKNVLVGNLKLLKKMNISCPDAVGNDAETIIACAVDGIYAGYVALSDTIKSGARQGVKALRSLGIKKVIMLSGDRREIADIFGKEIGVDEAYGDLLPQDKASIVEKLASDSENSVAFVGDGMNDAPVLAVSNVGIAMGGMGSDAAIESADIVIQTDDPSRVATAIKIGRYTRTIVMENIIGAIAVKVAIMTLGFFGLASLWGAVFADVGVALLAVLNSLRIMAHKYV